jgi:histone deacetylase complex regulatory component SIN3
VIARVKELFKGNNFLIQEFNAFLPPGYKIEPDAEGPSVPAVLDVQQQPDEDGTRLIDTLQFAEGEASDTPNTQTDLDHARNYVRKIKVLDNSTFTNNMKNRFALQPHIYKTFLEILHAYYQGIHLLFNL